MSVADDDDAGRRQDWWRRRQSVELPPASPPAAVTRSLGRPPLGVRVVRPDGTFQWHTRLGGERVRDEAAAHRLAGELRSTEPGAQVEVLQMGGDATRAVVRVTGLPVVLR